jgi:hypothetical protein
MPLQWRSFVPDEPFGRQFKLNQCLRWPANNFMTGVPAPPALALEELPFFDLATKSEN